MPNKPNFEVEVYRGTEKVAQLQSISIEAVHHISKHRNTSSDMLPFIMDYPNTEMRLDPDTVEIDWQLLSTDLKAIAEQNKETQKTERQQRVLDLWSEAYSGDAEALKPLMAFSAQGHTIFDSFAMIKGRDGLYSVADLTPTLKQHFKHVVFRGVKYI